MAQLLDEDLLVVQLSDGHGDTNKGQVASVKFESISKAIKPPLAVASTSGDPANPNGTVGVIMPGAGVNYNGTTGVLDVVLEGGTNFVDLIVILTDDGLGNKTYTEPDYTLTDEGESPFKNGDYYIVGDTGVELDPAFWNVKTRAGGVETNLGDQVIVIDVVETPTGVVSDVTWDVIPNVTGGQAVLGITAVTTNEKEDDDNIIQIDDSNKNFPEIRVQFAGKETVNGGATNYFGGLITSTDYEKLNTVDTSRIDAGWVLDLSVANDPVSIEALDIVEVTTPDPAQYKTLTIGIEKATETQLGVTSFISSEDLEANISQAPGTNPIAEAVGAAVDGANVTTHFVPRNFGALISLEQTP